MSTLYFRMAAPMAPIHLLIAEQLYPERNPAWKNGTPLKSTSNRTSTVLLLLVKGWPVGPMSGPWIM